MDDLDLDELERLANDATPGPWTLTARGGIRHDEEYIVDPNSVALNCDGRFIAAARTAVPALIAEARRLRAAEPTSSEAEAIARMLATYDSDYCGSDVAETVEHVREWLSRQGVGRG